MFKPISRTALAFTACALTLTACTSPSAKRDAHPVATATKTSAPTSRPSPHCPPKNPKAAAPAAEKDGVRIAAPVRQKDTNGFLLGVDVPNCGKKPARYEVNVRLIGPRGYLAFLQVRTDTVQPGQTVSGVYTARDEGGTSIEEGDTPHVVIYNVITEKP
ncbi:hypothetical protein [Streptomyces chattanoogensis]|uniref:Lipoprotein n=1 Tax=Streptomyces chattanoogensis TaxID=66876 RepID=A0A0N0GZ82_9ACTN|nr:hypothetical protein [Streptomyces chattanoogensis]KPC62519.1 hypothetical protein ADL29_18520 [Streptomyces chattanoogensis]